MNIWLDLATREGALLAILLAIGSGPASLLPRGFDAASRIALAPVLGFCLGTCVTTTLLEFLPAGDTAPVVVVLMVLSLGFAARRTLRAAPRWSWPSARDAAQLLAVCVAVTGPLTFALHERHTVGPAAYTYTDVDNYVAVAQAAQTSSLREAREAWLDSIPGGTRFANLGERTYGFIADFNSNLDATPLYANVNALLGLPAVDTNAPFLIVLLLMGGLGAFAAVRRIAPRPTWMAVLAGGLFGGPLFLEVWFDTFQAAIVAMALLVPAVVLGREALTDRRSANLVLLALVLATLVTSYPLFVPPLIAVGALAVVWQALARRRAGTGLGAYARGLAGPLLALAALTAALDPVGLLRMIGYYATVFDNDVPLPRVGFTLPAEVLPGWLLQTREFWFLTPLHLSDPRHLVLGVAVPLVLLAFAVVAVRRHRVALALAGLGGLFGLAALYGYSSRDACTYCAQRYLLALAPILAVLLAVGLEHVLAQPSRRLRAVGIAVAVLAVLAVGQRTRVELDRFVEASYFLDSANRAALERLPEDGRPLHVEGYWASVAAQAEQPLVYHLATASAPGRVSISLGSDVRNALQYLTFGQLLPPGPEFRADYRYLLTRLPGVRTARRIIARHGGMALAERTQPLDVTPYTGLSIELARRDGSGIPWVDPGSTLGFSIVGTGGERVWARLRFSSAARVAVARRPGVRARWRAGTLTVCVRATGRAPVRTASVAIPAPAAGAVRLTAMHAVSGRCMP